MFRSFVVMRYGLRSALFFFTVALLYPLVILGAPTPGEMDERSLPPRPLLDLSRVNGFVMASINLERKKAGIPALQSDGILDRAAAMQSRFMAEQGRLSHSQDGYASPADRVRASCPADRPDCLKDYHEQKGDSSSILVCCSENVIQSFAGNFAGAAYYTVMDSKGSHRVFKNTVHWYDERELADTIVQRWMDSPSHRKHILELRYRVTGFSVVEGKDGNYYATQLFAPGGGVER